jgi:multiple sugar transport system permease protein
MAERSLARDLPRLAILGLIGAIFVMPYLWMISAAIKPASEIFAGPLSFLPRHFAGFANFTRVLEHVPVARILLNGAIVCGGILFFQLLFAIPAGYALAKLPMRGRSLAMGAVMLGLLVPVQTTALPIYAGLSAIGWLDTYAALIAPFTISVFAIFLFRQFFRSFPDDLLHAARLDGMSELGVIWRVVLPNSWPAATAFAIFSVVAHWNDLFWPMMVVGSPGRTTPALSMLSFVSNDAGQDYGATMALASVMIAPLVIAFLLAQRRFVEGIATAGLKG